MNTLNRKSKNSRLKSKAISAGVKTLATGVAVTAICMSSFTTKNIPGVIINAEAKELENSIGTGALEFTDIELNVNQDNTTISNGLSKKNMELMQGEIKESLIPLVEAHPDCVDSEEKFSSPEDLETSIQNVDDTENPEIKAQRDAERKIKEDEELLNKYSFALYTSSGQRNDITPDILRLAEQMCQEQDINCNLWLSLVMTESEGKANAKNRSSTATGLGQLLAGTGKYVYEDIMGNGKGTYNHSMAYDPVLNTRMSITLLGYLKRHRGSMYGAIQEYRGKKDISGYTSVMNRWLSRSGMSVNEFLY